MFVVAVLLSVVGLLLGPLLVSWTAGSRGTFAALDGMTLGIVPGLLLLRLLPHLVEETGVWAVAASALGYLAFSALEARAHARATDIGIAIVLPALALHGFLDGAGLALAFEQADVLGAGATAVGAALVLHKIPEGLFLASALLPARGARVWAHVTGLALATVAGAWSGRELLARAPDQALHVVVALGLGVMLRMAIHRHGATPATREEQAASGAAFAMSLAALLAAPDPERLFMRAQPGELSALQALAPLLLETAPWLLLTLLAGEWLAKRASATRAAIAHPQAMWLAVCALSLPLLGVVFTLARALLELLCSAARTQRIAPQRGLALAAALRSLAVAPLVLPPARAILPSYFVGVVLAVAIEAAVPGRGLDAGVAALPFVVALALLLRIGAPGVTVVVALLVHKGLTMPLALLFATIATHTAPWELSFATLRTLAIAGGTAGLLQLVGPLEAPPLHALAAHAHPPIEWLSAAAITLWGVFQLVMSGPRTWFGAPDRPRPAASGRRERGCPR